MRDHRDANVVVADSKRAPCSSSSASSAANRRFASPSEHPVKVVPRIEAPATGEGPRPGHPVFATPSPPVRRPSKRGDIIIRGVSFSSISEAVCGLLLELYLPGFAITYGETFQVPLGEGRAADFCVHGVLVEFHPIRMRADRQERRRYRSYNEYLRAVMNAGRERGSRLSRAHRRGLAGRRWRAHEYAERRRRAVRDSVRHHHRELVVVTTVEEFYFDVIRRFSAGALPSESEFFELFEQLTWYVRREIRKSA